MERSGSSHLNAVRIAACRLTGNQSGEPRAWNRCSTLRDYSSRHGSELEARIDQDLVHSHRNTKKPPEVSFFVFSKSRRSLGLWRLRLQPAADQQRPQLRRLATEVLQQRDRDVAVPRKRRGVAEVPAVQAGMASTSLEPLDTGGAASLSVLVSQRAAAPDASSALRQRRGVRTLTPRENPRRQSLALQTDSGRSPGSLGGIFEGTFSTLRPN